MRLVAIAMASTAMLMVAGCSQKDTTTVSNSTAMAPTDDPAMTVPTASAGQTFANAAAASDAFEIETSRLALASSSSASVKKFAQKMIDAHTASTAKLKAAASSAAPAITPDPTLTAEQRAKVDGMKALKGAAFDQAYVAAQSEAHRNTLDALRAYSANGDVVALKTFATELVPVVAAHLNMVKVLKP